MSRVYVVTYIDGDAGEGPIMTASDLKYTQRLSLLGDWSFQVPLSDARAADRLRPFETYVEISIELDGDFIPLVAGRVESVQRTAPDQVTVSGYDLLRELTYRRLVNHLLAIDTEIEPDVLFYDGGMYMVVGDSAEFLLNATDSFLFVGYTEPFDIIHFTFEAVNTKPAQVNWGFSPAWSEPGVTDGTDLAGAPLGQNGDVLFVRPGNWTPATVDGLTRYWMRLDPEATLDPVTINSIRATIRNPDPDDIETLLNTYAPTWNLPCYTSTSSPRVTRFYGETLFEAITLLAGRNGDHFRLGSPFGRDLCYMRDDLDAPTIQLMAVTYPTVGQDILNDPNYAYIRQLKNDQRTDNLITRLYVFGAGQGNARYTLAQLSDVVPSGYTVDLNASYIQHTAAVGLYGVIEGILEIPDIGPGDGGSSTGPDISNALFRAGKDYLDKHIAQYVNYQFELVGSKQLIPPGSRVDFVWERRNNEGDPVWTFDSHGADGPLTVLEVQTSLSADGLLTTSLTTAKVIRYPENDQRLLVETLHLLQLARRHPQPILERLVRSEDYTDL